MYKFVDTTESPGTSALPGEALKINGQYIENLIPGYRTLYVKGRELLPRELSSYEVGAADGSRLKSRRYPARTIAVGYQLIAKDSGSFRRAYNRLNAVLNVEEVELIFQDEPDKFFVGTPSEMEDVEPGANAITGEFSLLCADPFKYSVKEYEASPSLDDGRTFLIDYRGTYKSYPALEADFYSEDEISGDGESANPLTGKGDCGYVAFFNDGGKIVQFGDPEEADGESIPASQTLVSQSFQNSTSWGTAAKKLWTVNGGGTSSDAVKQSGSVGVAHAYGTTAEGTYYLHASGYGTGSQWHGPSVTRVLPADKSGHAGAANFTLSYSQKISIGSGGNDTKQLGGFQVMVVDGSKRVVVGFTIFKNKAGKSAIFRFYVNHKVVADAIKDLSYNNQYFGTNTSKVTTVKTSTITKAGAKVTFNMGGYQKTFTDSAIKNMEAKEITFTFFQYGTKTALARNGLYHVKFVKNNCETWKDIPNKFSAGDVLVADCKDGSVFLNGASAPELGALGNDWEDFCLKNGENQISASYSDWTEEAYAPKFKLRYREVYL